jgi:uncharacterized SAM-binding protein YcdF (DUF218 family)
MKVPRKVIALILLVVLWPFLARMAAASLIVGSGLDHADAVAVFSGSATYVERAQKAAELFNAGAVPLVILSNDGELSGWSQAEQRNIPFLELAKRELVKRGVPPERILVVPGTVNSTYIEAARFREFGVNRELHSILFVTSPYHSRRALWTVRHEFAGSGLLFGIETPAPGWQSPRLETWWLSIRGWKIVGGEWIKLVYYSFRY